MKRSQTDLASFLFLRKNLNLALYDKSLQNEVPDTDFPDCTFH